MLPELVRSNALAHLIFQVIFKAHYRLFSVETARLHLQLGIRVLSTFTFCIKFHCFSVNAM